MKLSSRPLYFASSPSVWVFAKIDNSLPWPVLAIVIAAGGLITDRGFMMCSIAGADPVLGVGADGAEDADDDANGAGCHG